MKKLKELKQIDGQAAPTAVAGSSRLQAITIGQLLGDKGDDKYDTRDLEVYKKQINALNKSDLYTHATEIGLRPVDNRDLLERRLVAQFIRHVSSYNAPVPVKSKEKKVSPKVLQILAMGK